MKRTYDVGMDDNSINIGIKVGTVGVAYTAVYLFRTGGQWTKLLESNQESGNIQGTAIGLASFLRKSYIIVRTMIDLSHLTLAEREIASNNIVIEYSFSGGFSGVQKYNFDNDDITITPNNKLITIIKPIEML